MMLYLSVAYFLRGVSPETATFIHTLRFHYMAVGAAFAWVLSYAYPWYAQSVFARPWFQCVTVGLLATYFTVGVPGIDNVWILDVPLSVLYGSLIMAVSVAPKRMLNLEIQPLIRLGEISYGIYMYHMTADYLLRFGLSRVTQRLGAGPAVPVTIAYALGLLAITVGIAELSFRWFEQRIGTAAHRARCRAGAAVRGVAFGHFSPNRGASRTARLTVVNTPISASIERTAILSNLRQVMNYMRNIVSAARFHASPIPALPGGALFRPRSKTTPGAWPSHYFAPSCFSCTQTWPNGFTVVDRVRPALLVMALGFILLLLEGVVSRRGLTLIWPHSYLMLAFVGAVALSHLDGALGAPGLRLCHRHREGRRHLLVDHGNRDTHLSPPSHPLDNGGRGVLPSAGHAALLGARMDGGGSRGAGSASSAIRTIRPMR